jgi:sulfur-oxidizing protein SoxY
MNKTRRKLVQQGFVAGIITSLSIPYSAIAAWPEKAFKAKSIDEAINQLLGSAESAPGDIAIKAPTIAENGAVVPISVTSNVPNTDSISIFVVNNPQPLAINFDVRGAEPYVSTRIKMAKTSQVIALVESGGKLYSSSVEVKVTIGGCGG